MKKPLVFYLTMACALIVSCKPRPIVSNATQNSYTVLAISNLNQRVSDLESKDRNWTVIDPYSKSYQQLQTPFGALLVSTRSVTPYLDGYKVKVAIGNPFNIAFPGFKLKHWVAGKTLSIQDVLGKRPDSATLRPAETQSVKSVPDFETLKPVTVEDRTEILQPGSWTDIEFTVAPATADDIRHLRMSLDLNEVRLNEDSFN